MYCSWNGRGRSLVTEEVEVDFVNRRRMSRRVLSVVNRSKVISDFNPCVEIY